MRMDRGRVTAVVVLAVSTVVVGLSAYGGVREAPDEIRIHSELWGTKKHEDAQFTHKVHVSEYKIECTKCHHIYENGKNIWRQGAEVQRCQECHTNTMTGKELSAASEQEKKLSLFKAFHDSCRGCHAKEKKGPVKCTECHAKKTGSR